MPTKVELLSSIAPALILGAASAWNNRENKTPWIDGTKSAVCIYALLIAIDVLGHLIW